MLILVHDGWWAINSKFRYYYLLKEHYSYNDTKEPWDGYTKLTTYRIISDRKVKDVLNYDLNLIMEGELKQIVATKQTCIQSEFQLNIKQA